MKVSFGLPRVLAFRFSRHHLSSRTPSTPEAVCEKIGGIQAQVLSAAELMFRTRRPDVTRNEIHAALWEKRSLVKTYALRGTLHLLSIDDFPIFISALKNNRLAWMRKVLARFNISPREMHAMTQDVVALLKDGPRTQPEIVREITPGVSGNMKGWMDHSWSVCRQAFVEGLICHGPKQGAKATFALVDDWLGGCGKMNESAAREILFQRFLKAYGPASPRDFAKWTGLSMKEVRAVVEQTKPPLIEVRFDGREGLLLEKDFAALSKMEIKKQEVRLLPSFDPYLLAHVDKSQFLKMDFYKRIYRPAGWITPVILLDGRVVGCWAYKKRGKRLQVEIEPFEKLSKAIDKKIEREAANLADFLGLSCDKVCL